MATTLEEVAGHLTARGLKYHPRDEYALTTGFSGLQHYRDHDGVAYLHLAVQLAEEGRYFMVCAPKAYLVPVEKSGPFLQACAMIQWRTKLIQFEYDPTDGEVRPMIEFPLEESPLSGSQLLRSMQGLTQLVDQYDPVLRRALREGVVRFDDDDERAIERLSEMLSGYPPELLAEALRRAGERRSGQPRPAGEA